MAWPDAQDVDEIQPGTQSHCWTILTTPHMSVEFLLTSFVVVVSPRHRGAVHPRGRAVPGLARECGGRNRLHSGHRAPAARVDFGVGYLLWLAWTTLRERGRLSVQNDLGALSAIKVIVTAILINLLNPKLTLYFFAFLPNS